MKKIKLWIDDIRPIPHGWIGISDPTTAMEFISLNLNNIEEISFDHDLGYWIRGREITGYSILEYIEQQMARGDWLNFNPERLRIHSANAAVRKKMEQAITSIERMQHERPNGLIYLV